jgi:hypothetical protein
VTQPRICYYIPEDAFVEGQGYRVSIVTENEPGHAPTGTWPYEGKPGQTLPYFWGNDLSVAREIAHRQNLKLGLTAEDVNKIVTSSIAAQIKKVPRIDAYRD